MNEISLPPVWDKDGYSMFREALAAMGEEKLKKFQSGLIPGAPQMYGIRIPVLRKISKEILKTDYKSYLALEKQPYHEETIIEGLVLAGIKCGYGETLDNMRRFIPKITNWAINDTVVFREIKKHTDSFINDADEFVFSDNPWAQRFGFSHLMSFCLTDKHIDAVLDKVGNVDSDFYYVQMMQAWLVATAAAKQREKTLEFLKRGSLNETTLKMTAQKMRDSYRISKDDKAFVTSLY